MDLLVHIKVNIAHESSIIIQGPMTIVETARTQILIYLDQMLGLCIDSVKLPILVHNLLGGKRHYQLQSVMEETATNIYLGSPYVIGNMDIHEQQEAVYISGDIAETERATCLVKKLSEQKLNSLYHKEVTLDPRKLDWILLHQQDKLKKLLYDNGSFIHFPHIGAGIGTIQIYAENKINVERTLWLLNHMTYKICRATINVKQRQRSIRKNISSFIYKMANISGAEIMYHEDQDRLDIYGSEPSLRLIYQYFKDSPFTDYHLSTSISIELQAENRIFIQGKKYGKINKIIKSSGTNIKFLPSYNNSNCLVQVQSNDIDKVFHGLELLSQELPEERSFYVSEIYHRRIIGVGGKNIQRIMKKYGVYVKFSSTEEFIDHGGYFENEHNVFARTPRKYSGNLNQLYDEIMELITSENDQNWVSYTIMIPFYLHRVIPNQYSDSLRDYGRLHNTRLWWPPRSGIADVTVIGPIAHVHRIQIALSNLILHHDYLAIPASITLTNHLGSAITMGQLKQSIKLNWCVNIIELDPQLSEIKSTTRVKWETIQLFKNATIFLLTTTIDSSGHLPFSINDDPNFAYDCKYRLKMAKKALLDQLSTHPLLETSKSTPPSSYVNRSALGNLRLIPNSN
ncbi:uncharacterized protein BX664DRAFT_268665 [Halteromyces radiatus]|uniref:uncharacterized protein n=1 Tax=Halteromyces radiatus TaxID=101107 RepID=UPI00221F1C3F|nr:uncharacterized protein BX664DRAFT_268665 [Halteromyces radiatus]KAI8081585.1 hypothetical protein BX664DRAFT_268665 [Halteromyces radiatus]